MVELLFSEFIVGVVDRWFWDAGFGEVHGRSGERSERSTLAFVLASTH